MKEIIKDNLKHASIIALGVMTGRIITQVGKKAPLQEIMQSAHVSLMTGFITAFIILLILDVVTQRRK